MTMAEHGGATKPERPTSVASGISAASSVPTATVSDRASRLTLEDEPRRLSIHQDAGPIEEAPPPYSATLGTVADEDPEIGTAATVGDDGRINININQQSDRLSTLMAPLLRRSMSTRASYLEQQRPPPPYIPPSLGGDGHGQPPPCMNVVIQVVGSRGDVQPFVALGKVLRQTYGHRVRLATHPTFKEFVEENGLEHFDIGGDPAELMAFMVKNPGLMPGFDSMRAGDVGKRRRDIGEMIKKCWRSCYEAGDGTGAAINQSIVSEWMNSPDPSLMSPHAAAAAAQEKPFVADVIIANPPSFAHIHCAEKLGIPLHIMFTMPWSPTQAFPHPLANIQSSNADAKLTNYMSYNLVDMLVWQGLGDVVNQFRVHQLGLEPISLWWAPGILSRLKVPHTYCWSPALIPRPADWAAHITISGFFFLSLASSYTPPPDLQAFLDAGPPPVYIGFGSIVVDDPNAMTTIIFEAVKKSGQRALVSKGWGGLGADELGKPDNIYMIGNVPHDWLFKHVSCVVHHGGAGTTAAGIAAGKPTVIVPFFGDQPFWGAMVARAGAGPEPINHKNLTSDNLAEAIQHALLPASLDKAKAMAEQISHEEGNQQGAQDFHRMLRYNDLRCSIIPSRPAVWRVKRTQIRLSAAAAYTLAAQSIISYDDLKLFRPVEWEPDMGPTDPVTGGATSILAAVGSAFGGVADLPVETLKILGIHPGAPKKKGKEPAVETASQNRADSALAIGGTATPEATSEIVPAREASIPPLDTKRIAHSEDSSSVTDTASSSISINTYSQRARTDSTSLTPITTASVDRYAASEVLLSPQATQTQTGRGRSSSMAEALHALPHTSRPQSRQRSPASPASSQRASTPRPSESSSPFIPTNEAALDTVYGTGKGLSKVVGATLKTPMDFTMAVTKGFHNVPRLYGEDVRRVPRVTGIQSGLRTAGKEFGKGIFDGITGIVTQPVMGAKKGGASGFFKGFGRGLAGVVVKPSAAAYALPAYTMMGMYKEIQKRLGENVDSYIIAARVAQGYGEWIEIDDTTRLDIVRAWAERLCEVKGKRGLNSRATAATSNNVSGINAIKSFVEKRKEARQFKHIQDNDIMDEFASPLAPAPTRVDEFEPGHSEKDPKTPQLAPESDSEDAELEEAIRLSLKVEQQQPEAVGLTQKDVEEDQELKQAIAASLEEMKQADEEHEQAQYEKAMMESAKAHGEHLAQSERQQSYAGPSTEMDEEQQLRLALAESATHEQRVSNESDEHLERALAESKAADEEQRRKHEEEEEAMLEHAKQQSLADEEMRRKYFRSS